MTRFIALRSYEFTVDSPDISYHPHPYGHGDPAQFQETPLCKTIPTAIRRNRHRFGSQFSIWLGLFLIIFTRSWAGEAVTLAWDSNPEETVVGYRLHYGIEPGNYPTSVDVGNVTAAALSLLTEGQIYFVVVTAYNADGLESPPSNEVTFTLRLPVSEAPPISEVPSLAVPEVPSLPVSEIQGSPVSEAPTLPGSGVPGSAGSEVPSIPVSEAPNLPSEEPVVFTSSSYHNVFESLDERAPLRGFLTVRTTSEGLVTGQITINGMRYSWVTAFDELGRLVVTIHRAPPEGDVVITLDASRGSALITASLTDGAVTIRVDLPRLTPLDPVDIPILSSRYTVILPPTHAAPAEPQGYGYGLIKVSGAGTVRITGTLADGTNFTSGAPLNLATRAVTFYTSLYQRAGYLTGKMAFRDLPEESDADGTWLWMKPLRPNDERFIPAFAIPLSARAARYHATGSAPLFSGLAASGHATLSFSEGDLPPSIVPTFPVLLYTKNQEPALWAFEQSITTTFDENGLFHGEFTTVDGWTRRFDGVVFQKGHGYACGMFLDWAQSGRVELAPR